MVPSVVGLEEIRLRGKPSSLLFVGIHHVCIIYPIFGLSSSSNLILIHDKKPQSFLRIHQRGFCLHHGCCLPTRMAHIMVSFVRWWCFLIRADIEAELKCWSNFENVECHLFQSHNKHTTTMMGFFPLRSIVVSYIYCSMIILAASIMSNKQSANSRGEKNASWNGFSKFFEFVLQDAKKFARGTYIQIIFDWLFFVAMLPFASTLLDKS